VSTTLTDLRHRIHVLEAEQRRSYRLLARALEIAAADDRRWARLDEHGVLVADPITDPTELLEQIARSEGVDLARPAWVEDAEQDAA
jgi:hypothetical protein